MRKCGWRGTEKEPFKSSPPWSPWTDTLTVCPCIAVCWEQGPVAGRDNQEQSAIRRDRWTNWFNGLFFRSCMENRPILSEGLHFVPEQRNKPLEWWWAHHRRFFCGIRFHALCQYMAMAGRKIYLTSLYYIDYNFRNLIKINTITTYQSIFIVE